MADKKQPNLNNIFNNINADMLAAVELLDSASPWRDQVFELLMARLDSAANHYPVLQAWWQNLPHNPAHKAQAWAQANYAMRLLKQAVPQAPHVWALVWIYQHALKVFYALHATPEQALDKSMVALEQALDKYESFTSGAWLNNTTGWLQKIKA